MYKHQTQKLLNFKFGKKFNILNQLYVIWCTYIFKIITGNHILLFFYYSQGNRHMHNLVDFNNCVIIHSKKLPIIKVSWMSMYPSDEGGHNTSKSTWDEAICCDMWNVNGIQHNSEVSYKR